MRRGLIADLRRMKDPLDAEAARELTHLRRVLKSIASSARYTTGTGTERRRVYELAEEGLKLTKPE